MYDVVLIGGHLNLQVKSIPNISDTVYFCVNDRNFSTNTHIHTSKIKYDLQEFIYRPDLSYAERMNSIQDNRERIYVFYSYENELYQKEIVQENEEYLINKSHYFLNRNDFENAIRSNNSRIRNDRYPGPWETGWHENRYENSFGRTYLNESFPISLPDSLLGKRKRRKKLELKMDNSLFKL